MLHKTWYLWFFFTLDDQSDAFTMHVSCPKYCSDRFQQNVEYWKITKSFVMNRTLYDIQGINITDFNIA